ncbi:MAG: penicillin-binding protein [Candidatus Harrisonbacteria bacterium CG10_big_fil_rev_8_21_14_0_10_40_38]|uniref:Penicillin-binding protein n=1 Tax=Candidatus Harrisonbacteria bacterium CG10_big_fil_rev_8_21_14_0_10_40_38 TaxID=1974583 RepID=A0A2H0URB3_9BACT|nr:MAG: penicillin-binding protein [Candidatus Harrisonbacteria bacterium CG10_big_fil_rev_8_21_14_0_10_40_38]
MKNKFVKIFKKWSLKTILIGLSSFVLIGILAFALFVFFTIQTLPSPELLENRQIAQSTKIYDRTGKVLLYEIHGEEIRTIIDFANIPQSVKDATIAVEDAGFYTHNAVEVQSIIRAFFANIRVFLFGQGIVQGGSTITQQLAKKAFLSDERTPTRKIKELVLSIQLEKKFTKDEILEAYLNQIPYGSNAYGIEAASQIFFSKPAKDLTIAESALLAALPQAPSYYSPWGQHKDALMARWKYVLNRMEAEHFITAEEKKEALETELVFASPSKGIKAPHFVIMVQDYLNKEYGEDFVRTNGLNVITTLDWDLQEKAEKIVYDGANRNEELYKGDNASLVAEDPKTGQILSLVGSRDYFDVAHDGNFNVATQGLRQPGSSFKPFVYAAAFEKGFLPETIVFDLETEFDTTGNIKKSYKPGNYDNKFRGPVDLRHALAQSINVPAVKVLYLVGIPNALKTAQRLGITTLTSPNRYGLSLVLGGGEVKLIDMVHAYSVFADDGVKHPQSFILEIKDSLKNKVLESYRDDPEKVMDSQYTRLINDVLSDQQARAPIFGGSLLIPSLSHQIAVKTGTTNNYKDAWTIGYTPSLVVGVWAGNNDNTPMTREGASIAAAVPIWKSFMTQVLPKYSPENFPKPEPTISDKPIVRGEYIVTYSSDNALYPQVHNILFYVDRNNPLGARPQTPESDIQYSQWEEPVLTWAKQFIPNFENSFNKEIPPDSVVVNRGESSSHGSLSLNINSPANGDFIDNSFNFDANIFSENPIDRIEIYFNDILVQTARDISLRDDHTTRYTTIINPPQPTTQNLLRVVIYDNSQNKSEQKIILFTHS